MVVAGHGCVPIRGTEILADRQNSAADIAKIPERGRELLVLLAEAHHHTGLRGDVGGVAAGAIEQLQRPRVPSPRSRHLVQPRNGFGVVIEHVGPGIEHRVERLLVALKIRNQDFDPAFRQARPCFADRSREDRRAAVREIIAIDGGDDDVVQVEDLNRVRYPGGFAGIDRAGAAVRHRAIRARARADVAQDHERRGAMVPAFADVRAARVLADGVQVEAPHQALQAQITGGPRCAYFQPLGLRQPFFARRQRDDASHFHNYSGDRWW